MNHANDNTEPTVPEHAELLCCIRVYNLPGDSPNEGQILANIEPEGAILNERPKMLLAALTFSLSAIRESCAGLTDWIRGH